MFLVDVEAPAPVGERGDDVVSARRK